ncbi:Mrp/NBP35 family ATP-binding protein [Perlabentimonas gracilis]|uniref:Mrp/NBP35 family ATP-binding protein n=1 Tax=Perlabentimonas gracilis TaxID=2715279 RepID=UPI00140E58D6|nr:Mrp/NBP35 family ATP-binding protein [Perlabentimonas gracilis]NHB69736.1 Mrp/NBP35 family ATP-binding protein [Perlabentimonas gracilis]
MNAFEKISLPTVKNVIAVASGKGGVGKSTVSANLAIALVRQGYNVALVDADIFGPSIPRMFGVESAQPEVLNDGEMDMMFPIEKFGVKIMSIGFFVKTNQGLIWRGPMAANAMTQLLENTHWGDTDYMIIDFPPGTSDIQLTTVQKLHISGSIIVTTPQEIALNDARKAASLFNNKDLKVPILGVVENMSWFTPKPHPEEKYFIFGEGGGQRLANELGVPVLGQIPLIAEVGEAADKGLSVYSQSDKVAVEAFDGIVEAIIEKSKV